MPSTLSPSFDTNLCGHFISHWTYNIIVVLIIILCLDEEGVGGSGDDYLKVDSAWHGDIDSDADSVDSEEEDPLKWVLMSLV